MPKIHRNALILAAVLAAPLPAVADDAAGREAVEAMGRLNGIALACRYFDQTRRIKEILIDTLPKRRELGQLFDDSTNASFLEFHRSGRPCPSPALFEEQVEKGAGRLRHLYRDAIL